MRHDPFDGKLEPQLAPPQDPDPPDENGWLCQCGNWQDDGLHCSLCGAEPPWGCDCGLHEEEEHDEVEERLMLEDLGFGGEDFV